MKKMLIILIVLFIISFSEYKSIAFVGSGVISGICSSGVSAPSVPTQGSLTSTAGQTLTVNWGDVTGETSYTVYYSTSSSLSLTTYDGSNAYPDPANGTAGKISGIAANSISQVISNLTPGTVYYTKVSAYNAGGDSGLSTSQSRRPAMGDTFAGTNGDAVNSSIWTTGSACTYGSCSASRYMNIQSNALVSYLGCSDSSECHQGISSAVTDFSDGMVIKIDTGTYTSNGSYTALTVYIHGATSYMMMRIQGGNTLLVYDGGTSKYNTAASSGTYTYKFVFTDSTHFQFWRDSTKLIDTTAFVNFVPGSTVFVQIDTAEVSSSSQFTTTTFDNFYAGQ